MWETLSREIRDYFDLDPDGFLKGDAARRAYNGQIVRVFREVWPNLEPGDKDPYLDFVLDEHTFGTNTYRGFTQATLRSIMYIREIEKYFDPSTVDYLLDFGPGYGNNVRVWHRLFQTPVIKMCDIKILHPISKYYLSKHTFSPKMNIEWIHPGEIEEPPNAKNSLFFATHSLNECHISRRESIVPWLGAFEHVYIVYNDEFDGINNIEYFENLANGLPHEKVEITYNEVTAKWSLIATGL